MRIKNNTDIEIKPYEWLFIAAITIIIMLLATGNTGAAVEALTRWFSVAPKLK